MHRHIRARGMRRRARDGGGEKSLGAREDSRSMTDVDGVVADDASRALRSWKRRARETNEKNGGDASRRATTRDDETETDEDENERPVTSVEIAEESFGDDARGRPTSTSYGLRCARDVARGATVLELRGSKELITAQRCARTPALKALVRRWIRVQTSSAGRTPGSREDLRTRRGDGSAEARREDFKGDGDAKYLGLDETLLCCFIALEKKKGKSSSWYDYVSKLPTLDDFSSRVPAVMPIRELIRVLGHEDCTNASTRQPQSDADLRWILTEAQRIQRLVELTHRHIVSEVGFDDASISLDEFRWAHACVLTRAFQSPNAPSEDPWADMYERMDFVGSYLAPVLDFANHRRPREVAYEATEGDRGRGKVTVTSLRSFRKGDFIHITYGAKSNSELFFRYGFCVSSNVEPDGSSNDKIRVDRNDLRRYLRHSREEGDAGQGEDVLLQVAATVDYMYKPFAQLLEVALAHFTGSEAEDAPGVDELPVRDDSVWDVDEDVFGVDLRGESLIEDADEAHILMYGDEDDAHSPDLNERERNDTIRDVRTRREIQAALALLEYLGSLDEDVDARWRAAAEKLDDRRAYLAAQYNTWRASRRRALDVFAYAAHLRAHRLLDPARARDGAVDLADVEPKRARAVGRAVAHRLSDDADALAAARALATARDSVFEISLRDDALA